MQTDTLAVETEQEAARADGSNVETNEILATSLRRKQQTCAIEVFLSEHHAHYLPGDFRQSHDRSTENALVAYLLREAKRRKRGCELAINFTLPPEVRDAEAERVTEKAYRDLLADRAVEAWINAFEQVPRATLLVIVGIVILLLSELVLEASVEQTLAHTLSDAVRVGGWVALWTAIAGVFFDGGAQIQRARTLQLLAKARIQFQYVEHE